MAYKSGGSDPAETIPMKTDHEQPEAQPRKGNMSIYNNKEGSRKKARQLRIWKIIAVIFMVLSAVLVAGIIAAVLTGKDSSSPHSGNCTEKLKVHGKDERESCIPKSGSSNKRSKMYSGFAPKETDQIVRYMKDQKELRLVPAANATLNDNYIYVIEDYLPNKMDAIDWLDGKRSKQPDRKARVIVFMGQTQKVQDFLVWPIPNPKHKEVAYINRKRNVQLTWKSRPVCNIVEVPAVYKFILRELEAIEDIYFASFTVGDKCQRIVDCIYANIAPRVVLNSSRRHLIAWFFVTPAYIEDYYMYPIPFYMILSANGSQFQIVAIYYNGRKFNSLSELKDEYYKSTDIRYTLPNLEKHRGLYGSPKYVANEMTADQEQLPPHQYYPNGARFTVSGQHVEWLGWGFDIHSRTLTGLQIFDVKYKKERIAYELSMQDITVLYSGNAPDDFFKSYFDNGWSIGAYNLPLVRGVDCPSNAVYLNSSVYAPGEDRGVVLKDVICVFEHRNAIPLRRHYSSKFFERGYRYAFSMPDSVLIVRQLLTVWNYDYVFDYEFHQNGVIEIKVSSTGYIAVSSNSGQSAHDRGFVINPDWNTLANLHQHLFNFKLDLDIVDTKNNFKTVKVISDKQHTDFATRESWYQMFTEEKEIKQESDSALTYDFNNPTMYILYNKDASVYAGSSQKRGYRIQSNDFSKVVIPTDHPLLKGGLSWAKYQVAVTKHDESERSTASYFVQGDPFNPAVSFDEFLSSDSNLENVDLVAWVTVGLHHLPTYEDLPVTSTPGKTLSISLTPFNFFKRDPSIHSRDAALFGSDQFNITNGYFYRNDTCLPLSSKPMINVG